MKRVVIHIGLPKCGSTSLQWTLASNRDALLKAGIYYPDMVPLAGENPSDALLLSQMQLASALAKAGSAPCPMLETIVSEWEASGTETLLLSSESFVMRADRFRLRPFAPILKYPVEIVAFVRPYPKWFTSFYKQVVKDNRRRYAETLCTFVEMPPKWIGESIKPAYAHRIGRIARLLSAKVQVVMLQDGLDVRDTMTDVLGVQIRAMAGDPALLMEYKAALLRRGLPINLSLSDRSTLFLARFNGLAASNPLDPTIHRHLAAVLAAIDVDAPSDMRLLTAPLYARLTDAAAADRSALHRRFGVVLNETPPPVAPSATMTDEDWYGIADMVLARVDPAARDEIAAIVHHSSARVLA